MNEEVGALPTIGFPDDRDDQALGARDESLEPDWQDQSLGRVMQ